MTKYAAFLRGINVGGRHLVKMDQLRKAFEALGWRNVKTILASGNVLFETPKREPISLAKEIEAKLESTFGHRIGISVRRFEDLQKLGRANPFAKIKITPQTRLYVTFLSERPVSDLVTTFKTPESDFTIVRVTEAEIFTALALTPGMQTTDLMKLLEKHFGRNITTRNWNTIMKVLMTARTLGVGSGLSTKE